MGEASAAETLRAGGEFMVGLWRASGCVYIVYVHDMYTSVYTLGGDTHIFELFKLHTCSCNNTW